MQVSRLSWRHSSALNYNRRPPPPPFTFVIPAKAGIHLLTSRKRNHLEMNSRLRGNDEVFGGKVNPTAKLQQCISTCPTGIATPSPRQSGKYSKWSRSSRQWPISAWRRAASKCNARLRQACRASTSSACPTRRSAKADSALPLRCPQWGWRCRQSGSR